MDSKGSRKTRTLAMVLLSIILLAMAASPPLVGGPAPAFVLDSVGGKQVRLSDFKGKTVILNFWATWCLPCTKEMPELQKTAQALQGEAVVVGVNLAESKDKVAAFVQDHHLSFPVALDTHGSVSQEYEVLHLPVTYLITSDGIIRDKIFGGGLTRGILEDRLAQIQAQEPPSLAP